MTPVVDALVQIDGLDNERWQGNGVEVGNQGAYVGRTANPTERDVTSKAPAFNRRAYSLEPRID